MPHQDRESYFAQIPSENLADAAIVFLNPDNGLDVKSLSKRNGHKYVIHPDVKSLLSRMDQASALVIYQHLSRQPRKAFLKRTIKKLGRELSGPPPFAIRDNRVAFFIPARNIKGCRSRPKLPSMSDVRERDWEFRCGERGQNGISLRRLSGAAKVAFRIQFKPFARRSQFEYFLEFVVAENMVGFPRTPARSYVFNRLRDEHQRFRVQNRFHRILIDESFYMELAINDSLSSFVIANQSEVFVNLSL